jgi:hypothetical protein
MYRLYKETKERMLRETATPWEESTPSMIPMRRWVKVETVSFETHPSNKVTLSDESERRLTVPSSLTPGVSRINLGQGYWFKWDYHPNSPRLMQTEDRTWVLVKDGEVIETANRSYELQSKLKFIYDIEVISQ